MAAVVAGAVLVVGSLPLLGAGGGALWLDRHRDDGYGTSAVEGLRSDGDAVTTDRIVLDYPNPGRNWTRDLLGTVRITARAENGDVPVFVGIAPTGAVEGYLAGVRRTVLGDVADRRGSLVDGGAPAAAPGSLGIWAARDSGAGLRTVTWEPEAGDWTVVVMNADARAGVAVTGDVGATVPALDGIVGGLLAGGTVFLVGGALLIALAVRRTTSPGKE